MDPLHWLSPPQAQKYRELEKQVAANKSQEAEKYNAAKARIQELERCVANLCWLVLASVPPLKCSC